jgi:hypothetical protein
MSLGLAQLESSLFDVENTPQRKRAAQANEFLHKKSVIEALMTLLNLPSCNQYVVEVMNFAFTYEIFNN